jgi:hypothetical protein
MMVQAIGCKASLKEIAESGWTLLREAIPSTADSPPEFGEWFPTSGFAGIGSNSVEGINPGTGTGFHQPRQMLREGPRVELTRDMYQVNRKWGIKTSWKPDLNL